MYSESVLLSFFMFFSTRVVKNQGKLKEYAFSRGKYIFDNLNRKSNRDVYNTPTRSE